MTGKQLRNSILQWAIQGKLVPQDPNDEPASVLLERIRAEKARLVKEKKIKKDKNESIIYRGEDNSYYEKFLATGEVKCIDDEIPFDIPQGWEWCRLALLIFPPKYGTSKKSKPSGSLPVLRMGNIQDGEVIFDKLVYSNDLYDNKRLLLKYGDLLFNRTNSAELVGKTAIFRGQRDAIFAGYIILLRPIFISSEYLNFVLNTPYARAYCNDVKTIGVQQCNINAEKISNLLIPIPHLNETVRIEETIRNLTLPIKKYEELNRNLKFLNNKLPIKLRKTILQAAIQGRLVPQIESEGTAEELLEEIRAEKKRLVKEGKLKASALKEESRIFRGEDNKYYEQIGSKVLEISEEIPFMIPDNWKLCRLENVFEINPKNEVEDDAECAFIPMEYINAGFGSGFTYQTAKWKSIKRGYTHFADGDIAFAKITPCFQNRKSVILRHLPNGFGAGTTELKVLRPYLRTIQPEYVLFFLQSPYFIDEAIFKGTANQQRVITGYVERKLFPLPPIEEQKRIVAQIEKLFEQLS